MRQQFEAATPGTANLHQTFPIIAALPIAPSAILKLRTGMDAIASHRTFTFRAAAGLYREARRSLHTPASAQSRRGLDWMNFFIADVQTGFGSFVAFYLAQLGWSPAHIGIALSVGGIAAMLSLIPGGALADAVTWKRGLAAAGIIITAVAALILALVPDAVSVFIAQILQGATAGVITPAIGAISLGLVGRSAMSVRTGRNFRYSAVGHALTGALMGVAGAYIAKSAIFISAAVLCIPALIALSFIRSNEIDYARARNAKSGKASDDKQPDSKQSRCKPLRDKPTISTARIVALARNRELILFTAAIVLFQLADASMLPMMGENLATTCGDHAAIWMSGLIIVPQVVVAVLAPWVGFHSEKRGRRPLLLIGFALEPVRGLLLAASAAYPALVFAQVLSGITGAMIGVLTVIVVADLTAGTGRFNLATGMLGALSGIAASLSTSGTGFIFQALGPHLGYVPLAVVAALATLILWTFLNETKPDKYED
jgi:MFS family permease